MAGVSLSGLASGLDTNSLVTQLLAAESAPRNLIAKQQTKAEGRVTALQNIQTKVDALKTATTAMRSVANWIPVQTAESSNSAMVGATWTGGAASGAYSVNVLGLASSAQKSFSFSSPAAADTMTFGSATINLSAGATIDDAVSAINSAGAGVVAVNAQGKLVVSSTASGTASTFAASGGSLTLTADKLGTDARYTIDGGAEQTSSTNAVKGGLPGVDFALKQVGLATVTVGTPAPDLTAISGRVKGFVDAYNALVDTARTALAEKPVKNATTTTDLQKGTLFGDQGLVRMLSALRGGVSDVVPGLSGALSSLSDLGISTGAASGGATYSSESVNGKLVFDAPKFLAAAQQSPDDVRELLGAKSGIPGFSQGYELLLSPLTQTGAGFPDRIDQTNAQITRLKTSLKLFDDRLATRETSLRKQFAAMESALSASQSRQASLTAQLANLSG